MSSSRDTRTAQEVLVLRRELLILRVALWGYLCGKVRSGYTVAQRLEQFGSEVEARLRPSFDVAGVRYPPAELAFVAFKDAKVLELYAKDLEQPWRLIKAYPVLAASGVAGPKLREGDRQVPKGVYRVESLNPNSRFHLSVRLNYPGPSIQQRV